MMPNARALSCLLALAVGARGYADPERCSGTCFAHDPGLIQRSSDGVYFRFNTDTYIDIMKSDSLSGPWETIGNVLPSGTVVNMTDVTALWVCESFLLLYISITLPVAFVLATGWLHVLLTR